MSLSPGIPTPIFLFTDIEGSTRLWEDHPETMRAALARHDNLLRRAIEENSGTIFKTVGDAFCAVFSSPVAAVTAALQAQTALHKENWKELGALKVRIALHTGVVEERDGDYFGPPLNRLARLVSVGYGGQVLASEAAQGLLLNCLPAEMTLRDLGRHRLKDLSQPEQIYQLCFDGLPNDFPPLQSLSTLRHNLPVQVTSFIGRQQEIRQIKAHLVTTHLLTLTGPGGVGKTRLALQSAAEMLEDFPAGVWIAEIAPLTDGEFIPLTVAQALGIREESGKTILQTLMEWMRDKRLLLILDNCEHLLVACARFADSIIRSCPDVKLIVASREALQISGETLYSVPSFAVPDITSSVTLEQLSRFDTVRLFVERAHAVAPAFVLTPGNVSAVAQVCRRLDGIPLALELAAARVRAMPVDQIATRLDDRFHLLTGGSRTALPRQQTLRALIDWSYDLLTEPEKTLLCRLSVFAGGWTLAAAEIVCADETVAGWEVLDLLTGLVGKSLVLYEEEEDRVRYRLLETVRQYARDRLGDSGKSEDMSARHRDWCLALSTEAQVGLAGPEPGIWVQQLEAEHDNFRTALTGYVSAASGPGDDAEKWREEGLRLTSNLNRFWEMRGYLSEAQDWLTALLAQGTPAATPIRSKALVTAGSIAWRRGSYAAARTFYEQAKEYFAALEDNAGMIGAVNGLANVAWYQGDHAAAKPLYEESLRLARQTGDPAAITVSLNNLGLVANHNRDWDRAAQFFDECLTLRRERGDRRGIATALLNLSSTLIGAGNFPEGQRLNEESLQIYREVGDRLGTSYALQEKGRIAEAQGHLPTAHTCFVESLLLKQEMGEQWGVCVLLECLAGLAARHDWAVSARLYGAADALREKIGAGSNTSKPTSEEEISHTSLCAALGDAAFTDAWNEGRAMTLDQAVTYAKQAA